MKIGLRTPPCRPLGDMVNLYVRGVHSYELPLDILEGFGTHVLG